MGDTYLANDIDRARSSSAGIFQHLTLTTIAGFSCATFANLILFDLLYLNKSFEFKRYPLAKGNTASGIELDCRGSMASRRSHTSVLEKISEFISGIFAAFNSALVIDP